MTNAPSPMSAVLSPCGTYRYRLGRALPPRDGAAGTCLFIMLNPSTADALKDDPTIRRCMTYAARWGYARLEVVNLFAWRATDPRDVLLHLADAVGDNNAHIIDAGRAADIVVCGWGNGIPSANGRAATKERAADVLEMIRYVGKVPHCLGPLTKEGQPSHPLYLKGDLRLETMP